MEPFTLSTLPILWTCLVVVILFLVVLLHCIFSQPGFKIIKGVRRNQIGMKCIKWGEYALKAINDTNKWELVFEVSEFF